MSYHKLIHQVEAQEKEKKNGQFTVCNGTGDHPFQPCFLCFMGKGKSKS